MALTEADLLAIRAIVKEETQDYWHFAGMVEDLGGVEELRENHTWVKKQRELGAAILSAVIRVVVGVTILGALYALFDGLKQKFLGG